MYKGKRLLDVLLSIPLSLVVLVLSFPIGILIVLDSGFPVFVKLPRISKGKVVYIWKYRSMVKNAHLLKKDLMPLNERKNSPFFKIKNDPRITRVGKFLRKFRIDEFPQIFNVLKGELSIVGPRPHEPEEVLQYPLKWKHIPEAKGGITGLSQINGASLLSFEEEMYWDDFYLKNASFLLDLKIIFKTLIIFLKDPTGT
jgi:lipopolysaccharide/colanic/teichoic acid biosynthesis glycosyltransferase